MTANALARGSCWVMANGAGSRVVLRRAGSGLLVLIHEMGGTLESWDLVGDELGGRRRILRYDVRGAGLSQKFRVTLAISDLSADLTT